MYELVKGTKKIRNIDSKEYEVFIKAKSYVLFYLQFEELYEFVKTNFLDFWDYLSQASERYRLSNIYYISELTEPILFSNQKLANILNSFRTYEDHLKHCISDNLSEESNEFKKFKAILSDIYDSNFSYRFCYKLRNYIQHYELPIKKISYNDRQIINFSVNRDILMKYKKWGKVKEELIKLDNFFDIKTLINDYYNSLNVIHSKMRDVLAPNYKNKKSILENLFLEAVGNINLSKVKNNLSYATFIYHKESDTIINKEYIPYNVIIRIDNYINKNIFSK